ncbi:hypothetical protein FLL45_06930 [Aliikangiella marina]|uniref:DUF4412 domain-containing protein n=1 Tax=Aliikangiella marina TaxID=1712262 RepID=A0A545TBU5_9GAMM|nr:hypothetical protein [Aliikangiella marina]TQV74688.1 hypothetical protein FLL45_06930 [Aliikangiella marina]
MIIRAILLVILLASGSAGAEGGFLDKAKMMYDATVCATEHTKTICVMKLLLSNGEQTPLSQGSKAEGQSKKYFLVSPNDNWVKLKIGKARNDLVIGEKTGFGMVYVDWLDEPFVDFHENAKQPLMELAKQLKSEPEYVELDVWPYKENGAVYLVCYVTNIKTEECMWSATANVNGGAVRIFSTSSGTEAMIGDVVGLIASIDVEPVAEEESQASAGSGE